MLRSLVQKLMLVKVGFKMHILRDVINPEVGPMRFCWQSSRISGHLKIIVNTCYKPVFKPPSYNNYRS